MLRRDEGDQSRMIFPVAVRVTKLRGGDGGRSENRSKHTSNGLYRKQPKLKISRDTKKHTDNRARRWLFIYVLYLY